MSEQIAGSGICRHGANADTCPECYVSAHPSVIITADLGNQQLPSPESDMVILGLYEQALQILDFADKRVIATNDDLGPATEDLASIARLEKLLDQEKRRYLDPVNDRLKHYRAAFDKFYKPVLVAKEVTKKKMQDFMNTQARKRAEAEETNRLAQEVARRQAAANAGEITVDTTPVAVPAAAPSRVSTELGTVGTMKTYKFKVADKLAVPEDYKIVDLVKVGAVVRATKGAINIPGIEIIIEETLRVTTR